MAASGRQHVRSPSHLECASSDAGSHVTHDFLPTSLTLNRVHLINMAPIDDAAANSHAH